MLYIYLYLCVKWVHRKVIFTLKLMSVCLTHDQTVLGTVEYLNLVDIVEPANAKVASPIHNNPIAMRLAVPIPRRILFGL